MWVSTHTHTHTRGYHINTQISEAHTHTRTHRCGFMPQRKKRVRFKVSVIQAGAHFIKAPI